MLTLQAMLHASEREPIQHYLPGAWPGLGEPGVSRKPVHIPQISRGLAEKGNSQSAYTQHEHTSSPNNL